MANVVTYQRFWQRRDTAANWTAANPTLASGEFGYETDTKKLKIGDGSTAWNSLAYRIDEAPIDGQQYARKDGGWVVVSGGSGSDSFAADAYILREDFDRGFAESTATVTSFVLNEALPVVYVSATGISTYGASVAGHPGILSLGTGTTTTGYSVVYATAGLRLVAGGGQMRLRHCIRIPTLSDATNAFSVLLGMRDVITGTSNNLIMAVYTHGTNSGKWQLLTRNSGTTTTVNGTSGPAANTWTVIEIVINAGGTSVELFADGISQGTSSTNIPTTALGAVAYVAKTAGTTARTVDVDLIEVKQTLTTAR